MFSPAQYLKDTGIFAGVQLTVEELTREDRDRTYSDGQLSNLGCLLALRNVLLSPNSALSDNDAPLIDMALKYLSTTNTLTKDQLAILELLLEPQSAVLHTPSLNHAA